jgi:hypothetical protein
MLLKSRNYWNHNTSRWFCETSQRPHKIRRNGIARSTSLRGEVVPKVIQRRLF